SPRLVRALATGSVCRGEPYAANAVGPCSRAIALSKPAISAAAAARGDLLANAGGSLSSQIAASASPHLTFAIVSSARTRLNLFAVGGARTSPHRTRAI